MKEQKKLPRFHLKLTNREDFVKLMKGEYLSLNDNHLRIAIWYDLFDFNSSEYRDSVRELLETKEVFLVCKKTKVVNIIQDLSCLFSCKVTLVLRLYSGLIRPQRKNFLYKLVSKPLTFFNIINISGLINKS